ncbi:C-type lectin domain family 2 member D-like [Rhinatrema bivittatum]|uniref:C-type lectin domain family 2 member D-like n=1 Tax=Rhinatrema bivittatum TaxID=194408 RepID=UPI00112A71EC|nr:C-type lectin domain family 2 member D-like [Rhinatrema bivittatum]
MQRQALRSESEEEAWVRRREPPGAGRVRASAALGWRFLLLYLAAHSALQPALIALQEGEEEERSGKADFICRRFPVPVIALVLLTVLILALILGIIVQAVTQSKASVDSSPRPPPSDPCADGWIWYRRKCYFFSEDSRDWDTAQSFCTSHKASLAHIETRQELDFTIHRKGRSDHWIGLRREQGQPWRWTDGSEFNNTFSISQEPGCAYLTDGSVRSANCLMYRNWICTQPEQHRF